MPVGSDQLVKFCRLDCSPATVRNEMALLERLGFLSQPHASAGRIPTDLGYRFYVDGLMRQEGMDPAEEAGAFERMAVARNDVRRLLETVSHLISDISEELAVVITPFISHARFDRMELVLLSERRVLMVVHVQKRRVRTVVLETREPVTEAALSKTAALLNERLSGLTLDEIRTLIRGRFEPNLVSEQHLLNSVINSAEEWCNFSGSMDLYTAGTQNLFAQPEFSNSSLLKGVFSFVEDRESLLGDLSSRPGPVHLAIGSENRDARLRPFSVVTAFYRLGQEDGVISVIGPTRMRYARILPMMDRMARTVTECFR
jgi:heat-inducible transcriptional repressor